MNMDRHPRDGLPYYCEMCGAGIGEFMACEEPDCKLESKERAEARLPPKIKRTAKHHD